MAYSPATSLTTSPSLTHFATVYYSTRALDQVKKQFRFAQVAEPDNIPRKVGKTVQWYRYSLLASNTTPAPEGTVGAGLPQTTTTVSATVSEYADFSTISTLVKETGIDQTVENHSTNLGYRAGLSVDTITRAEFDANVASVTVSTSGAYASVFDLKKCVAQLRGTDVMPRDGDTFTALAHPYSIFDIQADNTAGGFIDIMKFANPQMFVGGQAGADGSVGQVGGCKLYTTTNVGTTGSSPNVQYYIYVVGKGAVGRVELSGSGPSYMVDPAVVGTSGDRFKISVIQGGPQIADPEGMIGAAVSYRFVYTAKTLDSTNYRYRMIPADASLV